MTLRLGYFTGIRFEISYIWLAAFGFFAYSLSAAYFHREFAWLPWWSQWALVALALLIFGISLIAQLAVRYYTAVKLGVPPDRIRLFLFGGTLETDSEPHDPVQELKLASVGPLFSLGVTLLAGLTATAFTSGTFVSALFIWLTTANSLIAGLSLLPLFPLDGGRILRVGIWKATGDCRKATLMMSRLSQYLGWMMMGFGALMFAVGGYINGFWLALLGWFTSRSAALGYYNLVFKTSLAGVLVKDLMTYRVESVEPSSTLDSLLKEHFLKTYSDAYPVADESGVLGVISVREIRSIPRTDWNQVTVGAVMRPIDDESLASAGEDAWLVVERMLEGKQEYLVVVDGSDVLGLVNRDDAYRSLLTRAEFQV